MSLASDLGAWHEATIRNKTVAFMGLCLTAHGAHGVPHGYEPLVSSPFIDSSKRSPWSLSDSADSSHDGICRVTRADQTSRFSPRLDEDETWRELCIRC
ncbi:hypothetical protein GQ607_013185 [Colletotrichum asianum]|uniref:Uncharacterized protein n=1 Tax=Colletotrichum asianum TaxID=702518 RepID=A0A8H3ZL02_9PEZI|nr:hypothetical protein GQ607_013185 [Colletotrichum asianum]